MIAKGIEMLNDVTDFRHDLNGMVRGGPYVFKADVLKVVADQAAEIARLRANEKPLLQAVSVQAAEIAALQDTNAQLRLDVAEAWAAREVMRSEKDAEIAALKASREAAAWLVEVPGAPVYDKLVRRADVAEEIAGKLQRDSGRRAGVVPLFRMTQAGRT